jgi:predicted RNA-binding protein (virulence factor B family)
MHPLLGQKCRLRLARLNATGAWLIADPEGGDEILLPGLEIPEGAAVGAVYDGFVYLDSKDRTTATLRQPLVSLGEVACLRAVDVAPMGCFVDWGLPKDLLVPKAEQTHTMSVGKAYFVSPYIDPTARLAATMKVAHLLRPGGGFRSDEWVPGVAYRTDPRTGLFVILQKKFIAVLPASEKHTLRIGQDALFRISRVLPDGKVEVSLRKVARDAIVDDAQTLLAALARVPVPALSDASPPEVIQRHLGLSKKAFKRAASDLLKRGLIVTDERRELRLKPR